MFFENPLYVNFGDEEPDLLFVEVLEKRMFSSAITFQEIAENYTMVAKVPSQAKSLEDAKQLKSLTSSASNSMLVTFLIPLGF